MKPTFSMRTNPSAGGVTVHLEGDLDGMSWDLVSMSLRRLREDAWPRVVLDLSGVRDMHVTACSVLADQMSRYREANAQLLILPPRG